MKAPVDREQVYFEDWDEAALRRIINQQRKITETSKQLKMRSLYQILIVVDDEADSGYLNKKTGNSVIDTLFVRGRHFQISTLVSTQKLRLVSNAVRVNSQFFCVWRLRNQLEKDSLLEELTALVPKPQLEAMYEAAVAEPYSFLYIYLLNPLENMFHIRFERVFQLGNAAGASSADGTAARDGLQQAPGLFQSECRNINCCSSAAAGARVCDPSKPPWTQQQWQPQQPWLQQTSVDSAASVPGPAGRLFGRRRKSMTTIWIDSRKRVAGRDEDFEFDIGETVHLPGSARLGVFKIRVADTFLSTDRGTYLYWRDTALGTLNWAQLPSGAYTGARLAAWISSNFSSATYVESRNELEVAHDSNRLILNDQELRAQFPGSGSYPAGATPSKPLSINHLLGPSFINEVGNQQVFTFVQMQPYSEIYLRCGSLANAAETVGPLGHDIIAKIICKQGVGYIMESHTHENHMVNLRGPITLQYLRFKLTDYEGNLVNLRGTSISFCIYLDG